MISVNDYLEILPADSKRLRGLRWAEGQDAIEYGNGQTFAHMHEVFAFLEGFASQRPLMHFGHVLNFLYLLRTGESPTRKHDFDALARAWRDAGRPARTAGAFCAVFCRDVPPVSAPPSLADLAGWLATYPLMNQESFRVLPLPEEPSFLPDEFEGSLRAALEGSSDEELLHWFRHGQPPVRPQGEDLARALLASKPPTLETVLAELSRHDRLSGAVPFVTRLVSALTLPPRRLIDRELPLGGYADVTTRGSPEQILPGQFALDELEFLRRYAEHELLFYRREEPASRTREELVVLLDQGVRTWGQVRLVLAACVFALGQLAHRRKLPLLLAGTADGGHAIDPLHTPADRLAELLSASDLTPHPGLALEQVLADRSAACRRWGTLSASADVVLLTHPRNLTEPDVLASARTAGPHTRLFAVAVDAHGEVHFCEVRHGDPVTIGQFHLDLSAPAPAPRIEPCTPWKGDCEPVGFPFRFGLASNHERFLFAFDHAGAWLLTAAQFGMLCASRSDGSAHEILPRVVIGGKLLTDVHQVLGVSGGFVVAGSVAGVGLVAAHYDFSTRIVKSHAFSVIANLIAAGVEWRYVRRQHLLILRVGERFWSVSLFTGRRDDAVPDSLRWLPRQLETDRGTTVLPLPPHEEAVAVNSDRPSFASHWRCPKLAFNNSDGVLVLKGAATEWEMFIPQSDGRPALKGLTLQRADCEGDVLAALFLSSFQKQLWLFRGPGGQTIATRQMSYERDGFALSSDGQMLALQRGQCQVEVRRTQPGCQDVLCVTPVGRFHNNVVVELGECWLCLAIDRTIHLARWESGRLEVSLLRGDLRAVLRARTLRRGRLAGRHARPAGAGARLSQV